MKKSNINNEQKTIISNALSNIVYNLKKHDAVDCITMFYYKKMDKNYITNTDMLRLDVMIDHYDENLLDILDEMNKVYCSRKNKQLFGLTIRLSCCFTELEDISYKSEKDLNNSIILYDKDGKYFKLQDDIKRKADFRYEYGNKIENDLVLKNVRK